MHTTTEAGEIVRRAALALSGTDAVIATDDAGTILYWNGHAEALYGWKAEEALGRSVLDVTPASMSQAEAQRIMQTVLRGETWSGQFLVRHRDGSPIRVNVTDWPVTHDGRVVGIVGISSTA